MKRVQSLSDLQASVRDNAAFSSLADYEKLGGAFLTLMARLRPTRIVSPTHANYIFYQYEKRFGHKITRPLNTDLFWESETEYKSAFERFCAFLEDLRNRGDSVLKDSAVESYSQSGEINRVIYTSQQAIGCIGDSFENPNQSLKRIGQLFENLVKLVIQKVGVACESRTISLPIPNHAGYEMSYELDVVFSRGKAIVASETPTLAVGEIVGSIKTTSKDRIDKVFLDKFLLSKFLGRDVPVIAVFLHDVQRAQRGNSIFGINSTFKSNHFLGYTVALNKLDGVYYVDPRPEMKENPRLREQIFDFQRFLTRDLWSLTSR